MGNRYYSAQKIGQTRARLVSNAGYVKPTALAEGVERNTVRRWRDGTYPAHVTAEQVDAETVKASEELAALWEHAATLGANGVVERLEDPDGRAKLNGYQLALVAAIATDKANLLRGRATERVEHTTLADFLSSISEAKAS